MEMYSSAITFSHLYIADDDDDDDDDNASISIVQNNTSTNRNYDSTVCRQLLK